MHRCDSIGRPVVLDGLVRGGVQEIEQVSAGATESARQHTEEPQSHTLQLRECGSITYERLEILLQRLDESARHSDDAVHFLRRRAEIEEVYAKSLRRLYEESGEAKLVSFRAIKNKLTRAPADSAGLLTQTSWRAWSAVTSQTLQASQLHQALAERLSKGAATQLAKVTLAAQTRRKEVEKLATGLAKDLRDANRALERADQLASIAHKHAVPASPPAGNRGPPLGSVMFGAFFKKQAATSEEAERMQSGARKRLEAARESLEEALPSMRNELQECECQRLAGAKAVLQDYLDSSHACLQAVLSLYSPVVHLVSIIDPQLDLEKEFYDGGGQVW